MAPDRLTRRWRRLVERARAGDAPALAALVEAVDQGLLDDLLDLNAEIGAPIEARKFTDVEPLDLIEWKQRKGID